MIKRTWSYCFVYYIYELYSCDFFRHRANSLSRQKLPQTPSIPEHISVKENANIYFHLNFLPVITDQKFILKLKHNKVPREFFNVAMIIWQNATLEIYGSPQLSLLLNPYAISSIRIIFESIHSALALVN